MRLGPHGGVNSATFDVLFWQTFSSPTELHLVCSVSTSATYPATQVQAFNSSLVAIRVESISFP
jgi:hypothetical protein